MLASASLRRVHEIMDEVRPLAAQYYRLVGKPLGITGEMGEYMAADLLGLELTPARTAGYDAIRLGPRGPERLQIKSRALAHASRPGKVGQIKRYADCVAVLLVIMDVRTFQPLEIWEAAYPAVEAALDRKPITKGRERGALNIHTFKGLGRRIWLPPPGRAPCR